MRPPLLALATLALAGCARSPRNGGVGSFTHIHFEFYLADNVDNGDPSTSYVYTVAIRPLTTIDPKDNLGPVPVVTSGSRNGIVAGRPTRLIEYDPTAINRYRVVKFLNPPSDTNDPDPGPESGFDEIPFAGSDPTTGVPKTLGFDITTQDLADSDDAARQIVAIQFNILTASKVALNSGDLSNRAFDALGDQTSLNTTTFNTYRQILITTSGIYSNTAAEGGQAAAIIEGANDVGNAPGGNFPAIDIVGYKVQVYTQ